MNPAYLPILYFWLIIFITSSSQKRRKTVIMRNIIQKNRTENNEMFELAKRFIEKECTLYTFDGNGYVGVIKEVTEGAVLLDRKGKTEIINLNMVVRIKEIVKK